jgi:hypothetical protein
MQSTMISLLAGEGMESDQRPDQYLRGLLVTRAGFVARRFWQGTTRPLDSIIAGAAVLVRYFSDF